MLNAIMASVFILNVMAPIIIVFDCVEILKNYIWYYPHKEQGILTEEEV